MTNSAVAPVHAEVADELLPALCAADSASCREAYRATLLALAALDERIVCLEADLGGQSNSFQRQYPDRYFNFGLAEANMVSAASGLAATGLVPFVHTMANFVTARACEQVKLDIAYHRANVKIVASYGGIAGASFGPTHHATEDLAILRALPGMAVVNPADAVETVEALLAAAVADGPWYVRLGRDPTPIVHKRPAGFHLGTAGVLRTGTDVTFVASGQSPVPMAVEAAAFLAGEGISAGVLNMSTLKPLDAVAVTDALRVTGAVVTIEEHNIIGGLGSAVAEVIAEHGYGRLVRLGVRDTFVDQGGTYTALLTRYGVSVDALVAAARTLLSQNPTAEVKP
ncbi:MAG TPA: transketolase C-terminal domain-containing protein [Micromonosporaceae bacterium]|nr:transketolase C-terminal domain-containing protein [Micromonosporaceae bacterium]